MSEFKNRRMISLNVLKRLLTDKQLNNLETRYIKEVNNHSGINGFDRAKNLEKPIPNQDIELLLSYLDDLDVHAVEIAEQNKLRSSTLLNAKVGRVAVKLLYQHRKYLDRILADRR